MNIPFTRSRNLIAPFLFLPLAVSFASTDDILAKYSSGQLQSALVDIQSALSTAPNDVRMLLLKAQIQTEQRRTTAAIATYKKIIEIDTDHLEAYNNLAALYADDGQLAMAKNTLESAISTHTVFNTLHLNLRSVYIDLSKNHYQHALKLKPREISTDLARFDLHNLNEFSKLQDRQAATKMDESSLPGALHRPLSKTPEKHAHKAIKLALENWAEAWSNRDIENYLEAYQFNYKTGEKSNISWAAHRRHNLRNKKFIKIALSNIEIQEVGDRYLARFKQEYESDTLIEVSQKELIFVLQAGHWKIEKEQNG